MPEIIGIHRVASQTRNGNSKTTPKVGFQPVDIRRFGVREINSRFVFPAQTVGPYWGPPGGGRDRRSPRFGPGKKLVNYCPGHQTVGSLRLGGRDKTLKLLSWLPLRGQFRDLVV
jgi:hypothetical protein